jgi:heterodisulfide reductase subunit A-like polyferredoxin
MTNLEVFPSKEPAVPTGSVVVVGGGIAGIQASLDLVEQGFKVYLVESQSAIGGKMAQLDKTFPTNDCAMCTISPKLVETGRHPNIQIMTDTEVLDVKGQAGNFSVTLQHKARYIDTSKCVGCGECTEVCPVVVPDRFNEGLDQRRAIFKLYPQAVPNAYAIEKHGISPCRDACPAGQRAQGYIALIREGRWDDAMRVIKMDNPFPGICGRICNHRCETACNRGNLDEPINIRALKRFVTDKVYAQPRKPIEAAPILYSQRRVAVIGSGPCGLTAARDLVMTGYPVTVVEAMPVAGGMLRLGVPEYRLPAEIIEREVQDILDLGVELRLNHQVDNLDDLFDEGFDAVLIAVGAHEGIRLPIPGANLEGVLINTHFLRDVRLGKYSPDSISGNGDAPPDLGENVLVLGGGNVAIDVARSAIRLGRKVSMAFLESRESMPSHDWEVQAALDEGIRLFPSQTFERIVAGENGKVAGVECMNVRSFSFDETGRLNVDKEPSSNHVISCDTVIFSVGQRAGLAFIPDDAGVGMTAKRTIAINPNTFAATRPGVFAAGDSVSGTAFVIEAVASGHTAAESIIRYLQGDQLEPQPKPDLPVVHLSQEELAERVARGEIHHQPRVPMPQLPVEQRLDNFAEVEGGYDDESAQREAARCLACGVCSECMSCTFACGVNAIDHNMVAREEVIKAGAIILAPGYQVYRAELSEEYGFGRYPNVITSLQYERIQSASGPTRGHLKRPSDGKSPRRIAFLQCVGSRDQSHDYCSSVCCMYAAKEAIMTIEHARAEARLFGEEADVSCEVFFMDTRAYSKGYEEYYRRAEEKYGIKYTRARISQLQEDPLSGNLILRYAAPYEGKPKPIEREFDLVVLSVGMEIAESVRGLGRTLGIELDDYGFCHTTLFDPLQTSRPGVYAAGPFREPKDIPESVTEASGAAAAAAQILAGSRFTLTSVPEYPPMHDVKGEPPRTGVFVCHCGSNIGGYLDVPSVAKYATGLPGVIHAEDNLYTCSQNTVEHIIEQVRELGLNRVVVASCTPLTHEGLFQDALRQAGLNPYLFEMANIRNQCSWIHSKDWEGGTEKAKSLVRMAVGRVGELEQLYTEEVQVNHSALVIGGGPAGMTAALNLADQGFPVYLVERDRQLGGNLRNLRYFVENERTPMDFLQEIQEKVLNHSHITTYLDAEVRETGGFRGKFTSSMRVDKQIIKIQHGVTIMATGGIEYKGQEYGYGRDPRILTQLEFEQHLADGDRKTPEKVVMIQCVGPAEKFCSRICCTTALKNALKLKELSPSTDITILYRDIRTYGFKEKLYTQARQAGIRFIHFEFERKPKVRVSPPDSPHSRALSVKIKEPLLDREIDLAADLVVLSTPMVPAEGIQSLASALKLSLGNDGFFMEAHVKLRPVDFTSDGVFMAGAAHFPKFLDETIAQAQAAASRAAITLSKQTMLTNASVAVVDPEKCVGCLTCVRICPYDVPKVSNSYTGAGGIIGAAYIEPAVCHGCGSCAAECPAQAIQLMHYKDAQVMVKLDALFEQNPERVMVK